MDNLFFNRENLKYCGKNVIIGKTVRIRKPEEVSIGDNTIIDDFTYISCGMTIGKNCHIASNVSISGGEGHFYLGDFSTISNHCSLHCASSDYSEMSLDLPSVSKELQYGGTVGDIHIGDFVTIGSHSCILPNVVIPEGFSCGAFSLLKDIKYTSYSLWAGIPAKFIKNRTGKEKLLSKLNKPLI
jgi:acetyltransferase-like isoleucine patch superfamily enzyme